VAVQVVPSGATKGGAGVLKPSYELGPKTEAEVNDGDPDPGPAKLDYDNADFAEADDSATYQITIQGVGEEDLSRIDVYLKAEGSVTALTENAPGSPTGTYLTNPSAWYSANLAGGTIEGGNELAEVIENEASGQITRPAEWTFALGVDPIIPHSIWHHGEALGGGAIVFEYTMSVGVALQAHRPEVTVGGGAVSRVLQGVIVVWDFSNPLIPVIAKQSDNSDAIWFLE